MTVNRNPIKELLTPDPDGFCTEFHTSRNYIPDTLSVWLNGLRLDRFRETGYLEGGSNKILMKEAPELGDSLQAQFDPE